MSKMRAPARSTISQPEANRVKQQNIGTTQVFSTPHLKTVIQGGAMRTGGPSGVAIQMKHKEYLS